MDIRKIKLKKYQILLAVYNTNDHSLQITQLIYENVMSVSEQSQDLTKLCIIALYCYEIHST